MAPVKYGKCAHPSCSCTTTSRQFCSTECEGMKQTLDAHCPCKHSGCKDSKHSIASSAFEIQSRIHQGKKLKKLKLSFAAIALLTIGMLDGSSAAATKDLCTSEQTCVAMKSKMGLL